MNDLEGVRIVRRLRQQSGNLMITLPRKLCRILGLTSGNYLSVRRQGQEIVISRINLGQDGPRANEHHRVPSGQHGNWIRKEQAAKNS
jgi:hypothetical protein